MKKGKCNRCLEDLGKCACENWGDDDPDLLSNKVVKILCKGGYCEMCSQEIQNVCELGED